MWSIEFYPSLLLTQTDWYFWGKISLQIKKLTNRQIMTKKSIKKSRCIISMERGTQKKRGLVLCHNDVRKDWVHVLHVHLYGSSSKSDQGSEPLHMVDQLSCRVCRVYKSVKAFVLQASLG